VAAEADLAAGAVVRVVLCSAGAREECPAVAPTGAIASLSVLMGATFSIRSTSAIQVEFWGHDFLTPLTGSHLAGPTRMVRQIDASIWWRPSTSDSMGVILCWVFPGTVWQGNDFTSVYPRLRRSCYPERAAAHAIRLAE
jgi:hypothetical protein